MTSGEETVILGALRLALRGFHFFLGVDTLTKSWTDVALEEKDELHRPWLQITCVQE
jgi:hypothetical protein